MMALPAIVKILCVFASVLVLTRVRLPLGGALLLGGVAITAWAGMAPVEILFSLGRALISLEMWMIIAMMLMIMDISRFLTTEKNAAEIVKATRRWGGKHGAAFTLVAMPAVIGLVPMPAGALFSAPFVKEPADRINGAPEWKAAVNYWFRHVWEYWWPLYPGVIIAMSLFSMLPMWQYMSVQFVFTPITFAAGYFFLIRPHVGKLAGIRDEVSGDNRRALFLLLPIVIVILAAISLPPLLRPLGIMGSDTICKLTAVLIGLLIAMAVVARDERNEKTPATFSSFWKPKTWEVQFSLLGVMIFKYMLTDSALLPVAGDELSHSGIPLELVVMFLPFVAGIVTGIAMGFAGTSFPLVVALVGAGGGISPLAALVLAYGFGYMGMMLSPIHLCLLVTKDYFSSSMSAVFRLILPCTLVMSAAFLSMHLFIRWVGW